MRDVTNLAICLQKIGGRREGAPPGQCVGRGEPFDLGLSGYEGDILQAHIHPAILTAVSAGRLYSTLDVVKTETKIAQQMIK